MLPTTTRGSEQPAQIRREILAAAPNAIEIGDRREAIAAAIADLGPGDLLVIAGRGMKPVKSSAAKPIRSTTPSSPAKSPGRARGIVSGGSDSDAAVDRRDAAVATGGLSASDWAATGVSIDTRSLAAGDLFVALRGPIHDGHDFVAAALARGAAAAMVDRDIPDLPMAAPLLRVADTLAGLAALGAAARSAPAPG